MVKYGASGEGEEVVIRLPRPTQLIRWERLAERSRAGERRRARVGAGSGVVVLFLALLWAAGLGAIAAGIAVGAIAAAALLELAAAAQAVGARRMLAAGRTVVRKGAAGADALAPALVAIGRNLVRAAARAGRASHRLATAPTTRAAAHQVARGVDAGQRGVLRVTRATAAAAADAARRGRRRRDEIAAEREARRLNALGTRLRRSGAAEAAAEQHRAALAIVRELGDRRAEALTLNEVALALAQTDDAAAVSHFEEAATILRELGLSQHEGQVIANLGITHRRRGRPDEANRLLETALAKLDPATPEHREVEAQLRRAS